MTAMGQSNMGQVYFYHLTNSGLVPTLAVLLEKSLGAGWRVAVRGPDPDQLAQVDTALWQGPAQAFLPHGLATADHAADQPILLGAGSPPENGATCLFSIGGDDLAPDEIETSDRACIIFDGLDPVAVDHARGQWKRLTEAGVKAIYWSEESGNWQKKTES